MNVVPLHQIIRSMGLSQRCDGQEDLGMKSFDVSGTGHLKCVAHSPGTDFIVGVELSRH